MLTHQKFITSLLFLTPLLLTVGANAKDSPNTATTFKDKIPWQVEGKARTLMEDLKKKGSFEVSRGYFKLWDKEDCDYTYARIGMCGNNPAAPYVIATVAPWKDEFVDPAFANIWKPSKNGFNDIYRLDPHEAIVIMGQLPPPGSFFSEQTWNFSRQGTFDPNNSRYQEIANSPLRDLTSIFFKQLNEKRVLTFASLSNPNNNVVIEKQSGASYGQMRYFIITPDKRMDRAVRKMLADLAVEPKDIFTEPIPSDMNVGLSEAADDFTTFIRYAHPNDGGQPGTPSYNWRTNPPLVLLRIREKSPHQNPKKYRPVVYEQRTAFNEHSFQSDLSNLMAAVGRRWGQPCANADCSDRAERFIDLQQSPIWMVGTLCLSFMENCLGDNWDASYHIHPPSPLDNDEIYAIAGTLGTKTGNAAYVSLSMNQIPMIKGVLDISDKELDGSAKAYSAEVNNADKFYLYFVTRNCSGLEHLTNGRCLELSMIPQGYRAAFVQRNYIRPGTQRGPDSALILPPMSMKLRRP